MMIIIFSYLFKHFKQLILLTSLSRCLFALLWVDKGYGEYVPVWIGYSPVMRAALDGVQTGRT